MKKKNDRKMKIQHRLKIFRFLIFFTALLVMSAITILTIGSMEDCVEGRGKVEGIREYRFRSMVTSKIIEADKSEGDEVKRGEIIMRFDPRDIDDQIMLKENVISELKAQIKVKQEEYAILQKDPLPARYRHAKIALDELRQKTLKSGKELEIYSRLFKRKVVSRREYQKIELSHLTNTAQLERADSDYKKVHDGLGARIVAKAKRELDLLQLKLKGREREKAMLVSHLDDYVIKAPEAGVITNMPLKPGAYIQTGDIALTMAATQRKKFVAMVNEKQIYKVMVGQKARIASSQYNYFEYGYFGGEVIEVEELPIKVGEQNVYPVKILLTREPKKLKLGSTGNIDIITGRDRIISCLLGLNR